MKKALLVVAGLLVAASVTWAAEDNAKSATTKAPAPDAKKADRSAVPVPPSVSVNGQTVVLAPGVSLETRPSDPARPLSSDPCPDLTQCTNTGCGTSCRAMNSNCVFVDEGITSCTLGEGTEVVCQNGTTVHYKDCDCGGFCPPHTSCTGKKTVAITCQ